jgi:hypothetical protein
MLIADPLLCETMQLKDRAKDRGSMRRNAVTTLMVAGLLVAGIVIGSVGFYAATTYEAKIVTQTETSTQILTTTTTQTIVQPTIQTTTTTPATITPSVTSIVTGQDVSIGVGWEGGSAPYVVTLYSSSNNDCSPSSTIVGSKSGLAQPQFVFIVSPTSTTHYCGTVSSYNVSSSTSSSVLITVNP